MNTLSRWIVEIAVLQGEQRRIRGGGKGTVVFRLFIARPPINQLPMIAAILIPSILAPSTTEMQRNFGKEEPSVCMFLPCTKAITTVWVKFLSKSQGRARLLSSGSDPPLRATLPIDLLFEIRLREAPRWTPPCQQGTTTRIVFRKQRKACVLYALQ